MSNIFEVVKVHSPVWADEARTAVNLEVTFAGISGELPFTASPSCKEAHSVELLANALAGKYGDIKPFVGMTNRELAKMCFEEDKQRNLNRAEARITILERAKRLGMITSEEQEELNALERESVVLTRSKFLG